MEININCDLGESSKFCSTENDPLLLSIVNSANVACGLAKLGVNVGFIGCVGDDSLGKQFQDLFISCGVNISALQIHENLLTRVVLVHRDGNGERSFGGFLGSNDNNFADAINHFNHAQEILINNNQSFDELKELKNTYNVIDLTYFYKTLIFLKKNDKDMLDSMNNKMVNDSKLMHGYKVLTNLISQFLNNKSDNIQDLYKSIYKDKNLNKNAKLFLYWVLKNRYHYYKLMVC